MEIFLFKALKKLSWGSMLGVPAEKNKGVASIGVWSFSDPKSATKKMGQQKRYPGLSVFINNVKNIVDK